MASQQSSSEAEIRHEPRRGQDPRTEVVAASIGRLRSRLLDLTARNPLVSFSHNRANGTRAHVRAVNGHIDGLYAYLSDDKTLPIVPLPPPEDEPADERQAGFRSAVEAARLTDQQYAAEIGGLSVDDAASAKAAAIERRFRDRVRESLGMPPRKTAAPTALADYAAKLGIDPSFELRPTPAEQPVSQKRQPVGFQALALPDVLERQLARIRDTARTIAEETGVSTLHLAFGFLEWFESDVSDRALTSPLLLLRVDIERRIVRSRYQYSLAAVGDEAQANLTLSERLDRDFRIKLPAFGEDERPEAYLVRVQEEVCKGRPRWTVRRFVTLAHFPFTRLAMFEDLNEAQWPEGLASHPVLAALLGGREAGASLFAPEHDVDAPTVSAKVPILVLDADASQHSAVYDAMCGQDLVIEGPPGTGKSQTITNIIAAALSNGKKVLFVADKQAALQVVKDRLDKVGLGDFCLELHSGKARKTDVLASLGQRLHRPAKPVRSHQLDEKLRELGAARAALTHYVALLNAPFGALGLTVHDVLWADRRRRDGEGAEARRLDQITLASPETFSSRDVDARRAALDKFERAAAVIVDGFGEAAAHPWFGVTRSDLPAVDMERAVRATRDAAAAMDDVVHAMEALGSFGLFPQTTLDDLGPTVQTLATLEVETDTAADWFAVFASADVRTAALEWRQACARYQDALVAQSELLTLPESLGPGQAAEQLAAALSAMGDTLPSGMAVGDLPAWVGELRTNAALLTAAERAAAETSEAVGITTPDNLGEITIAVSAVALAAEASQAVVDFVTPELLRIENAAAVTSFCSAVQAVRITRSELDSEYSIPPSADPRLLREHAATLASAGLFGFMRPAAKTARLGFAALLRTPRKESKAGMAAALISIAEHLEAIASIEADVASPAAFGVAHRGLATDVDTALAAIAWAARVRSALPQPAGASAVATLLSGNSDRLRAIRALAGRPEHRMLQSYLAQFPHKTRSFADLSDRLSEKASSAEALSTCCRGIGVPEGTQVHDLPGICVALQRSAKAAAATCIPPVLASVPHSKRPAALDEAGPFDAALQLSRAVQRLPLAPRICEALWLASPEMLRTIVVPAACGTAAALSVAMDRWADLRTRLGLDEDRLLGGPIGAATPGQVLSRLTLAAGNSGELGNWILFLREREAIESLGLGELLQLWDERVLPCSLTTAFDRIFHHALACAAYRHHPELERFTGLTQDEARARFAALDAEAAVLRRRYLADDLSNRPVPAGTGVGKRSELTDKSLILLEIAKKKRHIPIRHLLDRAGGAIQALKPCFMMSPLSIAQYLKAGGLSFDMLVIDEASQMRPEDAVGAVARCRQIVVVGDPKQLPPTAFFNRLDDPDDDTEAEEEVDAESILDLAQAVFHPMRRLRWHYRSRHESLIAFSNREFYDDDLIVFPSPSEADHGQGVATVKVDGVYKSRANLAEVKAVCEAAVEHMRTRPDRSLGIATMNQVQRELIAQEMDRLVGTYAEVEAYQKRWGDTLERFFVKNLENVQGDERDVIFVSTVFGPSSPGGKVLQRFGPINGVSGHRRLNVLFTRAKHHLRVFTSLEPDDILADQNSARGAQILKSYLGYAKTGRLDAGTEADREVDSDFEMFVRDRLRAAGFDAVPQVGVAGFFIDLALRDPRSPSSFLLGIECDGASYHSSRSARDRDILRQQVLESLGWTIYRIWSTDWFRDPEGQTRKLLSFIEETAKRVKTAA